MSRAASRQAKKSAQSAQAGTARSTQKRATGAQTIRNLQARAGNRATTYALSSGHPLQPELRASMEQKLNVDLSDVRIHTDNRAAATAESVDAKAYTVGSDIVFNRGEFSPQGDTGRRLLTHELAHVVQQSRGGPALDAAHSVSMEQSAETAASSGVGASSINVQGGSAIGIARAPKRNTNPLNMPKETVDMPWQGRRRVVQGGRERNLTSELGYKRSGPWFWRRWRDAHRGSGALSPENVKRINKGRAPVVDDAWIKNYPEHAAYKGQTLHHHHAGHGGTASPLPQDLHKAAKDKVFHAEKQNVSDLKTGEKLPPKADPRVRKQAVRQATNAGEIPRTKGGRTQRMPKVSPGSEVAALPKSQQGRAKIDTRNVDPKTGIVKKNAGKKAPAKGRAKGTAASRKKASSKKPGGGKGAKASKGSAPKRPTGPKKTPSSTSSNKGPQAKPNKGPQPAPPKGPTPEHAPPHTAKPGPATQQPSPQPPAGAPHVEPHTPSGEPKPAPHTTTAEPHVTPPSAPHPAPAARPTPPAPELKVEATARPSHMDPPKPAPAPTHAPETHVPDVHTTSPHAPSPHAPSVHGPNAHIPGGGGGKLGKVTKAAGPAIAVGLGIYNTYKDIKDGQKPGEAIAGNLGQTGVNLTSIGGPADMAINLANLGLQHTGAPEEVKESGNLLADVTPSTFGGNAVKQLLRAGYNVATGDEKAVDKQVDDINKGKAGTPLQGYSLWFTKIIPDLASGKDSYQTFNEASKMINNKTLEKAGNYLGDETYKFVNQDLPEAYEFAKKDLADASKAASEKWESTKSQTKGALKGAWNYLTGD